jgi:hypothetical protein
MQMPNSSRHNKFPSKLQSHRKESTAVQKQAPKRIYKPNHGKPKPAIRMVNMIKTIYVLECPECHCRMGTTKIGTWHPMPDQKQEPPIAIKEESATPPPSQPAPARTQTEEEEEEEPFACSPEVVYPVEHVDEAYLQDVDTLCTSESTQTKE